jgi:hypothetical protein
MTFPVTARSTDDACARRDEARSAMKQGVESVSGWIRIGGDFGGERPWAYGPVPAFGAHEPAPIPARDSG